MSHRVKIALRISKTIIYFYTRTMHSHEDSVAAGETGSSIIVF